MYGRQVWAYSLLLALLAGCLAPQLDNSQIGAVTATEDVLINDVPHRRSWELPADDVRSVFAHLQPRDSKYRGNLIMSDHTGSIRYRNKDYPLRWSRVKQGEKIYLIEVDGHKYTLHGGPAETFHKLLVDHGETIKASSGTPS